MSKFTIIECVEKVTKTGKPMKHMKLLEEGKENVEPRVAMWDNHPEFEEAKVGGTINGILEKKDSGTPIPEHPGKNYVNRTLLPEMNPNGTMALSTEERLSKLETRVSNLEVTPSVDLNESTTVEYPENEYPQDASPF